MFLRILKAYGTLAEPNYLEAAAHLCELAVPYLAEASQRQTVKEQLDRMRTLRRERDQDVAARIEKSERPQAYRNEYETAQSLFRLISGQVVSNLLDEKV